MVEHTGIKQAYGEESAIEPRSYESRRERSNDDVTSRLINYVKSRAADQIVLSGVKLRKTADALKKTSSCFNEEEQRILGEYVGKSANRIEEFSNYLQDTPIDRIIDDAREFSRKQPWLFMGASLGVGILLARIIKDSQRQS